MVSQKLLVVMNLTMLSAHLWNTILGNDSLKPLKLKRHKELKHKENADSVETFKAKRARYGMGERPCDRLLPYFSTTPALSYEVSLIIAVTNK